MWTNLLHHCDLPLTHDCTALLPLDARPHSPGPLYEGLASSINCLQGLVLMLAPVRHQPPPHRLHNHRNRLTPELHRHAFSLCRTRLLLRGVLHCWAARRPQLSRQAVGGATSFVILSPYNRCLRARGHVKPAVENRSGAVINAYVACGTDLGMNWSWPTHSPTWMLYPCICWISSCCLVIEKCTH